MKRKHTTRGLEAAIALASIITLTLSGCVSVRGGQSEHDASSQVQAIPGIASGEVLVRSSQNGFQKETIAAARTKIKPNYKIEDPEALVNYLIRIAWSTNETEPSQDLTITVDSAEPFNAINAAKNAGWTSAHGFSDDPTTVFVDPSEAKKRLGDWPGKVPNAPDRAIVAVAPSDELRSS
jgi:hypothetical protein